ncbi:hypothetical protein SAMN05428959_10123 [Duganella sp. CF517]|uniref:hypothetical protein n=1 Tax=Duganella sp. CF517 TaxID=1881038 RepID=UPI0008C8B7AC|nr:hypothetical protein [Duganella sp. CF517]SEN06345.1 hypothetical protein SAMN05428959_10123 [Duganella sp. CF517]
MLEERGGQSQQLLGPLTKDITKKLTDATTTLAKADKDLKLEIAGAAADAAGLVDATPTSDLVGAGISIARGDYWGAALSTVSMVPYLGDAVAKPMKAVRATKSLAALQAKVATLTKTVNDLKKAKKEAEALKTATKQTKLAKEAQGSSRNKRGSNSAGKDVGQERQRLRRLCILRGKTKKLLSTEGDVASYKELVKAGKKGDNITPNHIPSAKRMDQHGVSRNDGIAINM